MSEDRADYHTDSPVLSAVDFLNLAEERLVCRVDLAEIGRKGIVFVRELTADEKAAVLPRPKGKARMHKDQSIEIDWSQLSPDAAVKFLEKCLVSIDKDPALFFGANGSSRETAVIPADQLTPVYDEFVRHLGRPHLAREKLGDTPNAVMDLLVKKIREISGLDNDEDDDREKKD